MNIEWIYSNQLTVGTLLPEHIYAGAQTSARYNNGDNKKPCVRETLSLLVRKYKFENGLAQYEILATASMGASETAAFNRPEYTLSVLTPTVRDHNHRYTCNLFHQSNQ